MKTKSVKQLQADLKDNLRQAHKAERLTVCRQYSNAAYACLVELERRQVEAEREVNAKIDRLARLRRTSTNGLHKRMSTMKMLADRSPPKFKARVVAEMDEITKELDKR